MVSAETPRWYTITIDPPMPWEKVQAAYELGCAWAEAQAALPEGWRLSLEMAEIGFPYEARAEHDRNDPAYTGHAYTPAAALRALAARLREREGHSLTDFVLSGEVAAEERAEFEGKLREAADVIAGRLSDELGRPVTFDLRPARLREREG